MRIGLLTQWYDPEPGPAALPGVLARALVELGHEVRVLTGFPNYPTGRLYDGYRQHWGFSEWRDGVEVFRAPLLPSHDSSAARRAANYLSFASTAWAYGRVLREVEGLWVYNSPITVGLPLHRHSRGGRIPYYLQVQDLWPESVLDSGMAPRGLAGRAATSAILGVVHRMEREAAVIGVSSSSMSNVIAARHSGVRMPLIQSPNPADESMYRPIARDRASRALGTTADEFVVLYAGSIGDVQGLESVVAAGKLLRPASRVRIVLVGDGIAKARLIADAVGSPNVRFLDRVPPTEVPGLLAAADVHLVSLADRPALRAATPSKIATLLASAVPIVGHLAGDGAELIRRAGAGPVTSPGDPRALADALERLSAEPPARLEELGASGRAYYERFLSARAGAERVADALSTARKSAASRSAGHPGDKS